MPIKSDLQRVIAEDVSISVSVWTDSEEAHIYYDKVLIMNVMKILSMNFLLQLVSCNKKFIERMSSQKYRFKT